MKLTDLLALEGIDPTEVSIVLHKSTLQPLRRLFPALVFERPDLFEAYQATHSDRASASLAKRRYFGSFIPLRADCMIFAGLFEIVGTGLRPTAEIYADPRFGELTDAYGATDCAPAANIAARSHQMVFSTQPMETLSTLRGRLQIATPVGRTYVRRAENLNVPIVAITEEPITSPAPPDWREFILTAPQLRSLPSSWRARLREWRGIYMIIDYDGQGYIGAAYGEDNMLGRWRNHVAGDHGVTAELQMRDPTGFRFSILELVSPTATPDEVLTMENSWKERLHTRTFGLNKN